LELVVIFKKLVVVFANLLTVTLYCQTNQTIVNKSDTNKFWYDEFYKQRVDYIDSQLLNKLKEYQENDVLDIDSLNNDTVFYQDFVGYHYRTYINSKKNLRKSLLASKNPPVRKNINNQYVFFASLWVLLLIIQLKRIFPVQYSLLIGASYNYNKFMEFIGNQNQIFRLTKLITWFIISLILGTGIYAVVDYRDIINNIHPIYLIFILTLFVLVVFAINHLFKVLFSYAFNQPMLRTDYAVIFRIHAFIFSIILFVVILVMYYQFPKSIRTGMIIAIIIYLFLVYALSVIKFLFSRQFLKSGSTLILILYLCSFEILPLVVFVVSILRFLKL
jgi:hypothetical protein